jgi:hypothetical protein
LVWLRRAAVSMVTAASRTIAVQMACGAAPSPSSCRLCEMTMTAMIYGQEVEPPAHRQRLARGVPGGLGRSPDAADDADVVEMGGRRPRWPWGSTRGPAFSIAVAALVAGLLLGFIGGHLQSRAKGQ